MSTLRARGVSLPGFVSREGKKSRGRKKDRNIQRHHGSTNLEGDRPKEPEYIQAKIRCGWSVGGKGGGAVNGNSLLVSKEVGKPCKKTINSGRRTG